MSDCLEFDQYEPPKKGTVYVAQVFPCGPIKIGFSIAGAFTRLKALELQMPYRLRCLLLIEGASPGLEKTLHERFATARIKGEWFDSGDLSIREWLARQNCPLDPMLGVFVGVDRIPGHQTINVKDFVEPFSLFDQ